MLFFWDVCRENKIIIRVSQYPINISYNELNELARKNSDNFIAFAYRNDFWKWKGLGKRLSLLRK